MLKVAHHGSRTSTTEPFVNASRPLLAVVSVGARNPFRHPVPEVLARLALAGARVYRTDRDGAVIVETDGARLWVTRWATRAHASVSSSPPSPAPAEEKHHGPRAVADPEAVAHAREAGGF